MAPVLACMYHGTLACMYPVTSAAICLHIPNYFCLMLDDAKHSNLLLGATLLIEQATKIVLWLTTVESSSHYENMSST
jgi:hypothetical protein